MGIDVFATTLRRSTPMSGTLVRSRFRALDSACLTCSVVEAGRTSGVTLTPAGAARPVRS